MKNLEAKPLPTCFLPSFQFRPNASVNSDRLLSFTICPRLFLKSYGLEKIYAEDLFAIPLDSESWLLESNSPGTGIFSPESHFSISFHVHLRFGLFGSLRLDKSLYVSPLIRFTNSDGKSNENDIF